MTIFVTNASAADWLTLSTCNDVNSAVFSVANDNYKIDYSFLNDEGVRTEEVILAGVITKNALVIGSDLKEFGDSLKDSEITEGDLQGATYFELDGKYGLYVANELNGNTHSLLVYINSDEDPVYFGSINACKK
jgi:Cu2+-containing amine oxidase